MSGTVTQAPAIGTYRLDPNQSSVAFATRHMFGLAAVKGTFRLTSGELVIADPLAGSTVSAAFDAASFATGNPKRDRDVLSAKLLDVAAHPEITFRSTEAVEEGGSWRLRGAVTAHGVSAPVEVEVVEAVEEGTGLSVRATAKVDRYAHGVTAVKGMAGRWLDFEIRVHAEPV